MGTSEADRGDQFLTSLHLPLWLLAWRIGAFPHFSHEHSFGSHDSFVQKAVFACVGVPTTGSFDMTRCVRQGGMESSWTFNLVVKIVLAKNQARLGECWIPVPKRRFDMESGDGQQRGGDET